MTIFQDILTTKASSVFPFDVLDKLLHHMTGDGRTCCGKQLSWDIVDHLLSIQNSIGACKCMQKHINQRELNGFKGFPKAPIPSDGG